MKILKTIFLFLIVGNIFAQSNCLCCESQHKQFDFWVGEWVVKDTLGNKVGENTISKIQENCVLLENWKGAQGGTGTSMNYFDGSDSTWNQLWVDNKGNVLKLKGKYASGKMVLKSELAKGKKVDLYYNQITWSENKNGTVTQLWEIYDSNGKLLNTVFKGIYYLKLTAK
ncbi:hypothetical protein [Lutimonas zeaxanthinifaciens]|uniref:hypothetical protein n=1 Tax=Lutimonas zeaxanthinifaciens TaxID=3060215 RepID=UPI00265CCAEF|nr:hypothetical protein [Lutimonas sp. YSD2104]WKK67156.1 hypothetical protein QZH61_05910 [Lutimonas sp. YSD2104]